MPIREYKCEACEHVFDTLIRNKEDEAELVCENCGSTQLKSQLTTHATEIWAGGNNFSHKRRPTRRK